MILFEGINDLGTRSANADELIAAYRQIVDRARARKIQVYSATITPCGGSFYDTPELEAYRQKINEWVRARRNFDAVLDFDAAVRDPRTPTRLRASVDTGDHLHMNPEGFRMLADAVDLGLFANT
jgi:lysophospholipase L1-like esterase